jgi:hypothetical protein
VKKKHNTYRHKGLSDLPIHPGRNRIIYLFGIINFTVPVFVDWHQFDVFTKLCLSGPVIGQSAKPTHSGRFESLQSFLFIDQVNPPASKRLIFKIS